MYFKADQLPQLRSKSKEEIRTILQGLYRRHKILKYALPAAVGLVVGIVGPLNKEISEFFFSQPTPTQSIALAGTLGGILGYGVHLISLNCVLPKLLKVDQNSVPPKEES